jgi:ribosomal protein L17
MDADDERLERARQAVADNFAATARNAEAIAETATRAAEIHDALDGVIPGNAARHAERERRLAAAEKAAAEALRNHHIPSDEVREAIRDARPRKAGPEAGAGTDPADPRSEHGEDTVA